MRSPFIVYMGYRCRVVHAEADRDAGSAFEKAFIARMAALSPRTFMCCLTCRGDQRLFAVKSRQHAPQPAWDVSEVMYRYGGGELMVQLMIVTMLWSHQCSSA